MNNSSGGGGYMAYQVDLHKCVSSLSYRYSVNRGGGYLVYMRRMGGGG